VSSERPIRVVTVQSRPTAVIAVTTTWEEFPLLWSPLLSEVWDFVRATGTHAGRNVMLYRDQRPAVEVGVELDGPVAPAGSVVLSALPAGNAATTIDEGAPTAESLAHAHSRLESFCASAGHNPAGPIWEIYSHWNEDPAQMHTEIYHLLD